MQLQTVYSHNDIIKTKFSASFRKIKQSLITFKKHSCKVTAMAVIFSTQSFKTIPSKFRSIFLQTSVSVFFQPELTSIDMIIKLICQIIQLQKYLPFLKSLEKVNFLCMV